MWGWLRRRGDLDLAQEPIGADVGGKLRVEHFHRDRPPMLEVLGQMDGGHAAAPDLALELVAASQSFLQAVDQTGHCGSEEQRSTTAVIAARRG